MFAADYQAELEQYMARAAELLGEAARPLWLAWDFEQEIEKHLVAEKRRGIGNEPPVVYIDVSKHGSTMSIGMERCRWETPQVSIPVVKVLLPYKSLVRDFWVVRQRDYRRLVRLLRRRVRQLEAQEPPVMPQDDQKRLWTNTVGFLLEGQAEMARYGITPRRGVLLLGNPGNGKTTACRWLAARCREHGLEWRNVTVADYQHARAERELPSLFHLQRPGIVLFDDFDTPLRDTNGRSDPEERSVFLTELDGVRQKSGIVFMFTSNADVRELDIAMLRPGRIDVIVQFPKPDAAMRRRLIQDRWHPEMIAGIDLEAVVADTKGFSFAEMEEAKKLLVLAHFESGTWDWAVVRATLRQQRPDARASRPIGFAPIATSESSGATPMCPEPAIATTAQSLRSRS